MEYFNSYEWEIISEVTMTVVIPCYLRNRLRPRRLQFPGIKKQQNYIAVLLSKEKIALVHFKK
jgi:hypothetical protein